MCWRSKTKTSFGLKIDWNKVPGLPSKEMHERALTLLVTKCVEQGLQEKVVTSALSRVTVQWWNVMAPSPSTGILNTVVVGPNGVLYSGLTTGNHCDVAWRGSLARSAFIHELLHRIGLTTGIGGDPDHLSKLLWIEIEPSVNQCLSVEHL